MNRTILIVFCLMCIIGTASAFSVPSYGMSVPSPSMLPSGTIASGTHVTTSFRVDPQGLLPGDDLQFYTDLDNPKWSYLIILNGVENLRPPMSGRTLTISGYELSYSPSTVVIVRATLEGDAPAVTTTTNKTIILIQEINSNGQPITSTPFIKTATIVNSGNTVTSTSTTAISTIYPTATTTPLPSLSITEKTESSQSLNDAINLNFKIDNLPDNVVQLKVTGPNGFDYGPQFVTTNNGAYIGKIPVSVPGTYQLAINSHTGSILFRTTYNVFNPVITTQSTTTQVATVQPTYTAVTQVTTLQPTSTTVTQVTTQISTSSTTKSVNQLLEEQNKKIEEQNKLIADQNKKIADQSGLLDQIIKMFKGLFGQS